MQRTLPAPTRAHIAELRERITCINDALPYADSLPRYYEFILLRARYQRAIERASFRHLRVPQPGHYQDIA
jgi:hypothetical protein